MDLSHTLDITEDSSLRLIPWQSDFIDDMVKHANNKKIWRNLLDGFPHPYTKEDAIKWVELNSSSMKGKNFAICTEQHGRWEAIGGIGVAPKNSFNQHHVASIGYWLSEDYWNQGIISKCLKYFLQYISSTSFAELYNNKIRLQRIQACIFEYNPISGKVLEKNGFYLESREKFAYFKEGKLYDGLMYIKLFE